MKIRIYETYFFSFKIIIYSKWEVNVLKEKYNKVLILLSYSLGIKILKNI